MTDNKYLEERLDKLEERIRFLEHLEMNRKVFFEKIKKED